MAVTVLLALQAQPDKADELVELFRRILPETRAYDGCGGVEVMRNQDDPTDVLLIERWASREHFDRYARFRNEDGTVAAMGALAAAPPSVRYFEDTGA